MCLWHFKWSPLRGESEKLRGTIRKLDITNVQEEEEEEGRLLGNLGKQ